MYNSSVFAFVVSIFVFPAAGDHVGHSFFYTTVPLFSDCMAGGKPI